MEKKIKEVQEYFSLKILNDDFEIIKIEDYVLKINIDKKYIFNIWIGNLDCKNTIQFYDMKDNFIMFNFSENECEILFNLISPKIKKHKIEVALNQKEKELEILKNQIEKL